MEEADKGQEANKSKLERWLIYLIKIASDVVDVMASMLANPVDEEAIILKGLINKVQPPDES